MNRKVLTSSELVNTMGGGDAIVSMLKKINFIKFMDDILGSRSKRAEYTYGETLLMWFVSVFSGAKRLEDIYHHREHLKAHPHLKKGMSPDTMSKVIKELTVPNKYYTLASRPDELQGNEVNINMTFNRLLIESCIKLGLLKKGKSYVLDYDTSTIETKIKGARRIYDGKGKRGYNPGLASINNIPIYFECRNGNSSPKFRLTKIICEAIEMLSKEFGIKIHTVRVDGAGYSKKFAYEMDLRKVKFVTRVRDRLVAKQENLEWRLHPKTSQYLAEFEHTFGIGTYRVIVHKDPDYTGGLLSNDYQSSEDEIVKLYSERSSKAEGVFRDLKSDFKWDLPPMRKFEHNSTYMVIQALAYIVYKYLAETLSKKLDFVKSNMELKTFRTDFMAVAQKWVGDCLQFFSTTKNYKALSGFI